eukprot:Lankesteria_metandrocarpae@DN4737_c0_g2_i1.p4
MVLPLSVLKAAESQPAMVELKNGETYSGMLAECDRFMNLHLRDVVCTSGDAEKFWKLSDCYIRGNHLKYLRLPEEVAELAEEQTSRRSEHRSEQRSGGGPKSQSGGGHHRGRKP